MFDVVHRSPYGFGYIYIYENVCINDHIVIVHSEFLRKTSTHDHFLSANSVECYSIFISTHKFQHKYINIRVLGRDGEVGLVYDCGISTPLNIELVCVSNKNRKWFCHWKPKLYLKML